MGHIEDGKLILVSVGLVGAVVVKLLWHSTSLVLDEIECIHHELDALAPMDANSQHANHATLQ